MRALFKQDIQRHAFVGDDVSCLYLKNGGEESWLFVTFDYWRRERDEVEVYAESFCRKHQFNQFHIFPAVNSWFQTLEMEDVIKAFDGVRHPRAPVVTYGGSMGGFAALQFAKKCGAEIAVAISPQVRLDPRKPPYEGRWPEMGRLTYHYDDLDLASVPTVFVVYDPLCREDRRHLELLPAEARVTLVPVVGGGHSPDIALVEWKLIEDFLLSVLAGTYQQAALRSDIRHRRRSSAYYIETMNQHLERHKKSCRLPEEAYR